MLRNASVILITAHRSLRSGRTGIESIGVAVAGLGLAFHAAGIVMRCMIAGRPPVTNMYELIIWVSFAVSFFGMIFFVCYRAPIYLLAALPVTLIALLLVHQMPIAMPSSIDPLVPVLRDNFWLTIHVLTITLSYAAFALAMGFGTFAVAIARNPAAARADRRCISGFIACCSSASCYSRPNNSWWSLGKLFLGQVLGLGSKGDMGTNRVALLYPGVAWPAGGLVDAIWAGCCKRRLFSRRVNGVIRRELCTGKGLHSYGFGIGGETYVAIFVLLDLLFVAFAIWRYRRSADAAVAPRELGAERAAVSPVAGIVAPGWTR